MSGIRAWGSNIPISALSMQQVYCGLRPRIQRRDKYQDGHQHANSATRETLKYWISDGLYFITLFLFKTSEGI